MTLLALNPAQIETAFTWAAAEGWNPGLSDAACFLAQDAGMFLGVEDEGELVAAISATRYAGNLGFIGFYLARPEARGRGHGMAVWTAAMKRLEGRLIGLDGVVGQQANYRKSGFLHAWNNIRFGGLPVIPPTKGDGIVPAGQMHFAALAALDSAAFPAARNNFLRAWLTAPGHVAMAQFREGEVTGFGVIRPCREGHKIGPLIAPDAASATALAAALLAGVPVGPVFLDVPEPHRAAAGLAESLGLKPVFETARMYTGAAPDLQMDRIFGITSLELG
ncbi:acetyltransferase (GNAT) family protein [Humitalea rosea]|uniref:Acetyltransferase (GNAT) family protein n=1 Tax=Humitalea rosea TaxID=990373 RepID=A0A2W7IQX9_9PROT|nr:GNAT family N-acetyltransferase [Humitalea rosea]PZW41857.1 acetyltransferase (GNAT) family protein [Humitalea rosea]